MEVDAFGSPELDLPEAYVQTRLNLLTTLAELQKRSGGKVSVRIHETESFKKEATVAEQRYGIKAEEVFEESMMMCRYKTFFAELHQVILLLLLYPHRSSISKFAKQ